MGWEVIKWAYFVDTILRLMFLFSKTKFNDADSHIYNVNAEEGCVWESKTETEFTGNRICPREHVQEASLYFYIHLPQGRFPGPLWHSSPKSHPTLAICHHWDCKSHHSQCFLRALCERMAAMGDQTLLTLGEETFNEAGWSSVWNGAVNVKV